MEDLGAEIGGPWYPSAGLAAGTEATIVPNMVGNSNRQLFCRGLQIVQGILVWEGFELKGGIVAGVE